MNSKNNRVNHDFQIAYFLAGSCHTADGAWSLLCDLREDRQAALEANRARAHEIESESHARNVAGAEAELATIERCMVALEPRRRFKHLPDAEAHEAAQPEEWRLELLHRAQNQLLTTGTVTPDLFATMRMHPAFRADLFPALERMTVLLREGPSGRAKLVDEVVSTVPLLTLD